MHFMPIGGSLRQIWALQAVLQLVKSLQLCSNQELFQLTPATALRICELSLTSELSSICKVGFMVSYIH